MGGEGRGDKQTESDFVLRRFKRVPLHLNRPGTLERSRGNRQSFNCTALLSITIAIEN